jgi:hypothetical protein
MTTKTNQIIRTIIQYLSVIILGFYAIFRIAVPLVEKQPLFLDKNDGYVILVCLSLALAVEVVKKLIARKSEKL